MTINCKINCKFKLRMLISQQPCGKVRMARVRRLMLAQEQVRQTKSNKENGYMIKVMRLNKEGGTVGTVPLVRDSQRLSQSCSLVHNSSTLYKYNLS